MRQETKVLIEMVANHRIESLKKKFPERNYLFEIDDSGLRGSVQVFENDSLASLEFIESESTAGKIGQYDDYEAVVNALGSLVIIFPEAKYPREIAQPIFQSIVKEMKQRTGKEFSFSGFVYDVQGLIKPVK